MSKGRSIWRGITHRVNLIKVWLLNNRTDAATSKQGACCTIFKHGCVWWSFPHPEFARQASGTLRLIVAVDRTNVWTSDVSSGQVKQRGHSNKINLPWRHYAMLKQCIGMGMNVHHAHKFSDGLKHSKKGVKRPMTIRVQNCSQRQQRTTTLKKLGH